MIRLKYAKPKPLDISASRGRNYKRNYKDTQGVLEILCQFFNVQHNAVRRIDNDRQIRF